MESRKVKWDGCDCIQYNRLYTGRACGNHLFIALYHADIRFFSSEQAIRFTGYGLLPKEFTLEAYRIVFKYPEKIARAYGVSIFITVTGTVLGLFITTMAAYVISRKDFKYRNVISFSSILRRCLTVEW